MIIYFKIFDKQCLNWCDGIEEQEATSLTLRKQFKSINTYYYIITLIKIREEKKHY